MIVVVFATVLVVDAELFNKIDVVVEELDAEIVVVVVFDVVLVVVVVFVELFAVVLFVDYIILLHLFPPSYIP